MAKSVKIIPSSGSIEFIDGINQISMVMSGSNLITLDGDVSTGTIIGNTNSSGDVSVNGGIAAGSYYNTSAPANGMIISGNVGIGTTSPQSKLHVNSGDITISTGVGAVGSEYNRLNFWSNTAGQGIGASIGAVRGNNYVSGGLTFYTGELSVSERMRIHPNGNISVNTTSDLGAKFGIKGSGTTSATTSFLVQNSAGTNLFKVEDGGNIGIGLSSPTYTIHNQSLNPTMGTISNGNGFPRWYFGRINATDKTNRQFEFTMGSDGSLGWYDNGANGQDRIRTITVMNLNGSVIVGGSSSNTSRFEIVQDTVTSRDYFHISPSSSPSLQGTIFTINSSGNAGLGMSSSGSVAARLHVKGSGITSATTSFLVQNSAGTDLLKVTDDGAVTDINGNTFHSLGTDGQIPYTNGAGDDLEYSANFTWDGSTLDVNGILDARVSNGTSEKTAAIIGQSGYGHLRISQNVVGGYGVGTWAALRGINTDGNVNTSIFISNGRSGYGVGINAVPSAMLQVKGSGTTSATTSLLVENSAGTDLLKVADDGKVGIGITSPTAKLHVLGSGTTSATTSLLLQNLSTDDPLDLLKVTDDGQVNMSGLPTSSTGLSSGDLWNNSGVINII